MGKIYVDGKYVSGAGVIVIEDYKRKDGTMESCVILGRNKASRKYADFGGSYEKKHGNIASTGSSELREESRNLLRVCPRYLKKYCDIEGHNSEYYRCYFVKINGISRKYFCHNMNLIDKNNAPRCWRETDNIAHVPITHLNITQHRNIVLDINGMPIVIGTRVKKIFKCCLSMINAFAKKRPLITRNNMVHDNSMSFLSGTLSFYID